MYVSKYNFIYNDVIYHTSLLSNIAIKTAKIILSTWMWY